MKNKNLITWILILLISLALIFTTIVNPSSKKENNIKNIDSFIITQNEIDNIIAKVKNFYPKTNNITNIDKILEKKIISHIKLNITTKKLGFKSSEKEIIFFIKNAKIFKKNGLFSKETYLNYIEKQKIPEHIIQRTIKKLSENTKLNKIIKSSFKKNNTKKNHSIIEKIKYKKIYKTDIIKTIKIKRNFIDFEKNLSKTYKVPKIYKINYKKNNKKLLISNKDINKNIFKNIKYNSKLYLIKKITQNVKKQTYKKDLINQYKYLKSKKIIKKYNKNIKENYYKNNNKQYKIIFISPKCKKNYLTTKFSKNDTIKNKNGYILKINTKTNVIKTKNKIIQTKLKENIKNKIIKLKKLIINKNQTY